MKADIISTNSTLIQKKKRKEIFYAHQCLSAQKKKKGLFFIFNLITIPFTSHTRTMEHQF